jgi:uncharacterized protein (DUF1330 family)
MPAYMVSNVDVNDPEEYTAVGEGVQATFAPYGGRYLARRAKWEVLEGDWRASGYLAIVEFPTYEAAKEWYESQAYRPLRDIRQRSATSNILLVDGTEEKVTPS